MWSRRWWAEENFVDMHPNRSNNFCCGGGGGYLQSGYAEERRKYGELKAKPDPVHRGPVRHHPMPQLPRPGSRPGRTAPPSVAGRFIYGRCCASHWAFWDPTSASTWATTSGKWTFSIRKAKCRATHHMTIKIPCSPLNGCRFFFCPKAVNPQDSGSGSAEGIR